MAGADAISGAMVGASTGSLFGPIGTGIGALVGGAAGLFGKKKKKKVSGLDPQQLALYNQYTQGLQGQGPMAGAYNFDPQAANQRFDQNVSRPAYRNYQENIIPGITGQFRGKNLQNSSYAAEALARSGRDVQEGLDTQRANYLYSGEQNAMNNKRSDIQNILGMSTFSYQDNPNTIDQILSATGPAAAKWFSDYINSRGGKSLGKAAVA